MGLGVRLEGVTRRYRTSGGAIVALDDVTLDIDPGSVVALVGPSGSGKSTLLHLVGAMDRPDAGRISVGHDDVTSLSGPSQARFRRRVGFVFQRFHLLSALTVLDNVVAPVLPVRTDFDKFERARTLLASVGLADRERSLPSRLSGGEQQRVAIARALINAPGLFLADEPTGNLDSARGAEIMGLILDLRRERSMTVVVATHDSVVASQCDRIVRIRDGRLVDDVEVTRTQTSESLLGEIARLTQ
jgi:putative ABC transport system ATP-binding protein